jgi:hypothetical protein
MPELQNPRSSVEPPSGGGFGRALLARQAFGIEDRVDGRQRQVPGFHNAEVFAATHFPIRK